MKLIPGLAIAVGLSGTLSATASASEQIAVKAGCAACHAADKKPDKKLLGPSYKEIAAKYKGRADAVALLSERVRKGSKGVWGPVPMPPTEPARIKDAELKSMITWILNTPG